jgi:hypothetical protein
LREAAIGLADILIQMGRAEEGQRLLRSIVEHVRRELGEQGRPEFWYRLTYPVALVLYGEQEEALAMLRRSVEIRHMLGEGWYFLEIEPVYDALRRDPRFEALRVSMQQNTEEQRRELQRRRADGRIPPRGESAHNTASATAHE